MRDGHRTRTTVSIAMHRPLPASRSRRIAKWTGLVVCVVILAMWAVSTRMTLVRFGKNCLFTVRQGTVEVWVHSSSHEKPLWLWANRGYTNLGFELPYVYLSPDRCTIVLPFWLLFVLAAITTTILWHRDRRTVKPGHCRSCGYDLRASKRSCPECGTSARDSKDP